MERRKRIGLVAHDAKKADLLDWVTAHRDRLAVHDLWATGTTGGLIAEGALDVLVFFSDPMSAMPHDVDVKALVRLSTVYNIVLACNRTTADFVIASPLFDEAYAPAETDYAGYLGRALPSGPE